MQENSSEDRIKSLENTIKALEDRVTELTSRLDNDNKCLHIFRRALETLTDFTYDNALDGSARIRMLECQVFPQLVDYRKEVDRIVKSPQKPENPTTPPPASR